MQTVAPDRTPRSAASHLGLCCLPMSHKRDARLILVNKGCLEAQAAHLFLTDPVDGDLLFYSV